MRGHLRLSKQKSDVCPQLPSSVKEVIDRYIYVAEAMKDATTDCDRANLSFLLRELGDNPNIQDDFKDRMACQEP